MDLRSFASTSTSVESTLVAMKTSLTPSMKNAVNLKSTVVVSQLKESIAVSPAPENTAKYGKKLDRLDHMIRTGKVHSVRIVNSLVHLQARKLEVYASVERSFSQVKLIKTRLTSCLKDSSLFSLMKCDV